MHPHPWHVESLRTLHDRCRFAPPSDLRAWLQEGDRKRMQIRSALGLLPWPSRTPLNPHIKEKGEIDGVRLSAVRFESFPGFQVVGNIYRPTVAAGDLPAVLSPHGHWDSGRFMDLGDRRIAEEILCGAEVDPVSGRNPIQARCFHLAKMGCVVLQYDMVGYGESTQISFEVAHRYYGGGAAGVHGDGCWGLYSTTAELMAQSVMGIQAWNSIRALDLLCSLPGVDPGRIGVTGESGGATQTLILGALDARPKALFPAVMVSSRMQGGCTCENASLLRIGLGNIDIAALSAPRPMGLTTANDWTIGFASDGFQDLRRVWEMHGRGDGVELHEFPEFDHNFNARSRARMYGFMSRHLGLGGSPAEAPHRAFGNTDLAFAGEVTVRPGDRSAEAALLRWWQEDARRSLDGDRDMSLLAWRTLLSIGRPERDPHVTESGVRMRGKGWSLRRLLLTGGVDDAVRCSILTPDGRRRGTAVVLEEPGDFTIGGGCSPLTEALSEDGYEVIVPELISNLEAVNQAVAPIGPVAVPAYTYCYNRPIFLHQVHRAAAALALSTGPAFVIGADGYAAHALAVSVLEPGPVGSVVVGRDDFTFASVRTPADPRFLPGAMRYGDVDGLRRCVGCPVLGQPERLLSTSALHLRTLSA